MIAIYLFKINFNNYLHKAKLTNKHVTAEADPETNNTMSNLPNISGSTTEAINTIPESEQISDSFFIRESDSVDQ